MKQNLKTLQDLDPVESFPKRRVSKSVVSYQNSESIQEEDDENSSSGFQVPLGNFQLTCPQQPSDYQGSEIKAPTIYTNGHSMRNSSQRLDNRIVDISDNEQKDPIYTPQSESLIKEQSKITFDRRRIDAMTFKFIKKGKSRLNKDLQIDQLTDYEQLAPLHYRELTYCTFIFCTITNFLSIIFLQLRVCFTEPSITISVLSHLIQILSIVQVITDILMQRGPYLIVNGDFKINQKTKQSLKYDIIRLVILMVLYGVDGIEPFNQIVSVIWILTCICRQSETFENIQNFTQLLCQIIILWGACLSSMILLIQDISIDDSSGLDHISLLFQISLSILTHNYTNSFSFTSTYQIWIFQVYQILGTILLVYTCLSMGIWIEPVIKITEEKEKLLNSFELGLREKRIDYNLSRRCRSYLDYIINEDLDKVKDQLNKKLSPKLQEAVQLQLRDNIINNIRLFSKFSKQFKQAVIYWFDQVQFNPEEIIVQENTIDDNALYYIMRGQVNVQFLGQMQGKAKRNFISLKEGQIFGDYSFITGNNPYISVTSAGLTQILKIKRQDFIDLLKNYPQDNEFYCQMKDNQQYKQMMFKCYYCDRQDHQLYSCPYLQYFPNQQDVILRHVFPFKQERKKLQRGDWKFKSLLIMGMTNERAKLFQQKLSQEMVTSEDFPQSSQLPYSENLTLQSASYVSKSQSNMKSPDQQSYGDLPDESVADMDETGLDPFLNAQRKQQNKTTLRTAGFPFLQESSLLKDKLTDKPNIFNELLLQSRPNFESMNSKDKEELGSKLKQSQSSVQQQKSQLQQYHSARSMHQKLTFRYQQQQSQQMDEAQFLNQQQSSVKQGSIRQTSNRSNTYSNPISNQISNNASSNSRQQKKSPKLSPSSFIPKKKDEGVISSDHSLPTEKRPSQRKKSTKTGTKVSILNQPSGFQIFNTVENHAYIANESLASKFEKMCAYTIYQPHNNFQNVIARLRLIQKRSRRVGDSKYSFYCYVQSKVRRVLKLVRQK